MLAVPPSFFGLSTEYWALPVYERRPALFERVLALLHARGDGPLLLRIGGDSADHSFWDPSAHGLPDWAYALTRGWLRRTGAVVREARARLILDLNLVTATPQSAAAWARAAQAGLPPRSIAAFEIGNEPDLYSRETWRALTDAGPLPGASDLDLPRALTPAGYVRDFLAYAHALARAAPGVPLAGPALAEPIRDRAWLTALLRSPARRALGLVTVHRYPYSGCVRPGSAAFPTIARLLGPAASSGMALELGPEVALARRYGLPLRLTELNSITCGGRPGVSDSLASALWADNALFSLLRAGVSGVNLHVRTGAINAPFSIGRAGLDARPELYGLILFVRALGTGPELIPLRTSAPASHLHVWAVRTRTGRLDVLMIDNGPRAAEVTLHLPGAGPLTLDRLQAAGPGADSGVTLGGQRLSRGGRWIGRPVQPLVARRPAGYRVRVGGFSAVLAVAGR